MASNLYQRGGVWYLRVKIRGRDRRLSLRTGDRAEAKALIPQAIARAQQVRAGRLRRTWADAVVRWVGEHLNTVKPATADRYRLSLRMLDPYLKKAHLDEITRGTLSEIVAARLDSGTSLATIRRDLTVISLVFRAAIVWEWADMNPALIVLGHYSEPSREPIHPVPARAIAEVARSAPPGLAALIRFLARTGCRQEEAASLEWHQIRDDTVTLSKTKTNRPRAIALSPAGLRALPRPDRRRGPVFTGEDGGRFLNLASRIAWLVKQWAAAAPGRRRWRCHDLRHTFAIGELRRGRSIYDLARHLGHASVKTTEIYSAWLANPPE